jgi:hypothetical protein
MRVLGPASALWQACQPAPASPSRKKEKKNTDTIKKTKKRFNLPSYAFVNQEMEAWRSRPATQGLQSFANSRPYGKTAIGTMEAIAEFAAQNNVDLDKVPTLTGKRGVTLDNLKAWLREQTPAAAAPAAAAPAAATPAAATPAAATPAAATPAAATPAAAEAKTL